VALLAMITKKLIPEGVFSQNSGVYIFVNLCIKISRVP
jgi:hypothetical protein